MDIMLGGGARRLPPAGTNRDHPRSAGRQPPHRSVVWAGLVAGACAVAILVAAATAIPPTVGAVERFEGWKDPTIAVVITAPGTYHPDIDGTSGHWTTPVAWSDPSGTVHHEKLRLLSPAPVGTEVRARLRSDGSLRGMPVTSIGRWLTATAIGGAIIAIALSMLVADLRLLRAVTSRLRRRAPRI